MKTFDSQLVDQLENAPQDQPLKSLCFFGCHISQSDVASLRQHLQQEDEEDMQLRELEFVYCRFDDDGSIVSMQNALQDCTKLCQLEKLLLTETNLTIPELATLVESCCATAVHIRAAGATNVHENDDEVDHIAQNKAAIKTLLAAATKVHDLRLNFGGMGSMMPLEAADLSGSLRPLANLHHLTWNGLVLKDAREWSQLVQKGFCQMPVLKSLWLENVHLLPRQEDDLARMKEAEMTVASAWTRLSQHVQKLTLVKVAPRLLALFPAPALDHGKENTTTLQELELCRVDLSVATLQNMFHSTLQSQWCTLHSLKLQKVRPVRGLTRNKTKKKQPPALVAWKALVKTMPCWSHLAKLSISFDKEEVCANQMPSVMEELRQALQKNISLEHVELEVGKSVSQKLKTSSSPELAAWAARNRHLSRAQRLVHCHFGSQEAEATKHISRACWPLVFEHFDRTAENSVAGTAAVHYLVRACAATEWTASPPEE